MGMDYFPRQRNVEGFHLNWTGHAFMARVLEQSGATLEGWSGSNDGAYIRAATCRKWASILRSSLAQGRIKLRRVPSSLFEGGFNEVPFISGATIEAGSISELLDLIERFGTARVPTEMIVTDLDGETTDWIESFAAFLQSCGGCYQC